MSSAVLPSGLQRMFDGTALEGKVGLVVQIAAVDHDGWPRVATLSVGEVYTPSDDVVIVSLHAVSRTAEAVRSSGRAVLLVVHDEAILKVRVTAEVAADDDAQRAGRLTFRCTIVSVERDAVPYARVLHGIEYELLEPAPTLHRWADQIAGMQAVAQ